LRQQRADEIVFQIPVRNWDEELQFLQKGVNRVNPFGFETLEKSRCL